MALYFSDQYVQLNGEDIIVPPEVVQAKPNLDSYVENGHLYVNGYKYNKDTRTWKKTLYAKWLLVDMYTQVQLLASVAFLLLTIIILAIIR